MTSNDTFTKYKEQKVIFEKSLKNQFDLLKKRTESKNFKGSKEYHKSLNALHKEFKKLLRSFASVKEKNISIDRYSQELKTIRKYTTTVEGFIKIDNTVYLRTSMPTEDTEFYEYFSRIDSDISYICKFIKKNRQVIGIEEEEVIMFINKLLRSKQDTTRNIIRSTIKKPKISLDMENYNSGELLHNLRSEQIMLQYLLREEKDYDVIKDYEERLLIIEEKIKLARKEFIKEKAEKEGMRK